MKMFSRGKVIMLLSAFVVLAVTIAVCIIVKKTSRMPESAGSSSSTEVSRETSRGIVLGTTVNVRIEASRNAKAVASLAENDEVSIIETGWKREKIGEFEDVWLKIKTQSGVTGYVFSAYVFDLKQLYERSWGLESCSGVLESIRFGKNGSCSITSGCAEPGCGESLEYKGTFAVTGREIWYEAFHKGEHSISDRLYLNNTMGKKCLACVAYNVDKGKTDSSGDCGLWL